MLTKHGFAVQQIDSEADPSEFYELLYNKGIGTMVADLYLCWAHYYDYNNNFEKAESVYQKGIAARAEPLELLKQAHIQFGFSMSQRLLYKDETTRERFRSTMDEQRLALTSLRAYRHRHVGSVRTGAAVRSSNPGRVDQSVAPGERGNQSVHVFSDENRHANAQPNATLSPSRNPEQHSVVQTLLSASKKQENLREPGPWSNAKVKISRPFVAESSNRKLPFDIMADDDLIPLPKEENMYARGIRLPPRFASKNLPQTEFIVAAHRDDEHKVNSFPAYNKIMLFPNPKDSFSIEELRAFNWFNRKSITNRFTKEQDKVWGRGYGVPLRLPPFFHRSSAKQTEMKLSPFDPNEVLVGGGKRFAFNIELIYTPEEEFCPEEILREKWLNGDLPGQRMNEMELTCAFDRRESVFVAAAHRRSVALGGRKSILPKRESLPRKSILRKSVAPQNFEPVVEADQSMSSRQSEIIRPSNEIPDSVPATSQAVHFEPPSSERAVTFEPEPEKAAMREPERFLIFEDEARAPAGEVFKTPHVPPAKPRVSSAFSLDDDGDGCTTQTFNFFLKSQSVSTPKVEKKTPPVKPELQQRKLTFATSDTSPTNENDEGENDEAEREPSRMPFARRSIEADRQQYAEADMGRPHVLSAILELTEEANTISSAATTASSKSSSAEEFDYTKHTTHASTLYNQRTTLGNRTQQNETVNRSSMLQANKSVKNVTLTSVAADRPTEDAKSDTVQPEAEGEPASDVSVDLTAAAKPSPFSIFVDEAAIKADESIFKVYDSLQGDDTLRADGNNKTGTFAAPVRDELPAIERSYLSIKKSGAIPKVLTNRNESIALNLIEEKTETLAPALANRNQTIGFNLLEEKTETAPTQRVDGTLPFNLIEEKTENLAIPLAIFGQSQLINNSIFGKAMDREPTTDLSVFVPKADESIAMPGNSFVVPKVEIEKEMSKLELSSAVQKEESIRAAEASIKRDFSIFCDDLKPTDTTFPSAKRLSNGKSPSGNVFVDPPSNAAERSSFQVSRTHASMSGQPAEQKKTIDDEFYDLIQTPPNRSTSAARATVAKKSINVNSTATNTSLKPNLKNESEDAVADSTLALLEPMKEISLREHQKFEPNFTFCDDNPNTQMFSLNLQSIKNSTLISTTKADAGFKAKNVSVSDQSSSIIPSGSKNTTSFDDDFFKMAHSPVAPATKAPAAATAAAGKTATFSLDLSGLELNEHELEMLQNDGQFANFLISEPKTIRPSEFNRMASQPLPKKSSPGETSTSKSAAREETRQNCMVDESCMIVESTTASTVNPFDPVVKNKFLTEIDFVDFMSKMSSVYLVNRVQTIQPNTEMIFGDKEYIIYDQIASGSYGFVYA